MMTYLINSENQIRTGRDAEKFLQLILGALCLLFLSAMTVKGEAIKIGAIFSLSGKAKASNEAAVLGVNLAINEININGGILGKQLKIQFYDNQSSPIGSHIAAMKAVEEGVVALVGSVWSSHSLAIAKIAQKNQVPMISPISTVPSLTKIGNYVFRACYDDDFQGSMIAKFAITDLSARTAIIFTDLTSDYSLYMSKLFSDVFTSLGGVVQDVIDYKTGQPKLLEEIDKSINNDPDIVFLSGHDESGMIAKLLQEKGIKAIPIGSDGWGTESFFTNGGNTIKHGYYIDHWSPLVNDRRSKHFIQQYSDYRPFMPSTVLAYDAIMIMVNAIQNGGSLHGTDIRDSLQQMDIHEGVTGKIKFDQDGNAQKPACIIGIENGSRSLLKCIEYRN